MLVYYKGMPDLVVPSDDRGGRRRGAALPGGGRAHRPARLRHWPDRGGGAEGRRHDQLQPQAGPGILEVDLPNRYAVVEPG